MNDELHDRSIMAFWPVSVVRDSSVVRWRMEGTSINADMRRIVPSVEVSTSLIQLNIPHFVLDHAHPIEKERKIVVWTHWPWNSHSERTIGQSDQIISTHHCVNSNYFGCWIPSLGVPSSDSCQFHVQSMCVLCEISRDLHSLNRCSN